jgi:hypothetical protein
MLHEASEAPRSPTRERAPVAAAPA